MSEDAKKICMVLIRCAKMMIKLLEELCSNTQPETK